jgi:hypothetical protein
MSSCTEYPFGLLALQIGSVPLGDSRNPKKFPKSNPTELTVMPNAMEEGSKARPSLQSHAVSIEATEPSPPIPMDQGED